MHEPELDWETAVSTVYAEVVAEADPDAGTTLREATEIALSRVLRLVDDGDIKPDMTDVVKSALRLADKRHGKRADRLIDDTRRGRLTLFESEHELNTVVTLGKGLRKLWRNVNEDDVVMMDEVRYRNVSAQQEAYRVWRESFEPVRKVLSVYRTVELAIGAGAFDDLESDCDQWHKEVS